MYKPDFSNHTNNLLIKVLTLVQQNIIRNAPKYKSESEQRKFKLKFTLKCEKLTRVYLKGSQDILCMSHTNLLLVYVCMYVHDKVTSAPNTHTFIQNSIMSIILILYRIYYRRLHLIYVGVFLKVMEKEYISSKSSFSH